MSAMLASTSNFHQRITLPSLGRPGESSPAIARFRRLRRIPGEWDPTLVWKGASSAHQADSDADVAPGRLLHQHVAGGGFDHQLPVVAPDERNPRAAGGDEDVAARLDGRAERPQCDMRCD